jgi:hypothetical protein
MRGGKVFGVCIASFNRSDAPARTRGDKFAP